MRSLPHRRILVGCLALAALVALEGAGRSARRVAPRRHASSRASPAPPSARSCISAPSTWSPATTTCCSWSASIFFLYRLKDVVLYVSLFTHRAQPHAAGRRARRHPRQRLHHRRDHRPVGGLQGLREPRRLQVRSSAAAGHAGGGADLRAVPRVRPGDQAAGAGAHAGRAGHQHRQLQRRRRDRADAGADVRADRAHLVAHAARASCATPS